MVREVFSDLVGCRVDIFYVGHVLLDGCVHHLNWPLKAKQIEHHPLVFEVVHFCAHVI